MVGRLRWAVKSSSWIPTKQVRSDLLNLYYQCLVLQEWVDGLSVLQPEEVDRVGKFVFQKDAKFALVGLVPNLLWSDVYPQL